MKILRAKQASKQELHEKDQVGKLPASKMKILIRSHSVLAANLMDILESYQKGETKKLVINDWIQMQINQHPAGFTQPSIKVGLQVQDELISSSDSSSSSSEDYDEAENYQDVPASYKDVPIRTMSQLSVESKTIAEERKDHKYKHSKSEIFDQMVEVQKPNFATKAPEDLYLESNFFSRINNIVLLPNHTFIL